MTVATNFGASRVCATALRAQGSGLIRPLVLETPTPKNALVDFVTFGGPSRDATDTTGTLPVGTPVTLMSYSASVTIGRVRKLDLNCGASRQSDGRYSP